MRVLGIDLSQTSVKAVEMNISFNRFSIHDYHERLVPEGSNPEEQIEKLIQSLNKKPEKIVVNFPTEKLTFRNLSLPTINKKTIAATIQFELEDDLPFELKKCIFDYSVISKEKKQSFIHTAITLKKHLGELLVNLQQHDIDPDIVSTTPWAIHNLLKYTTLAENKNSEKDLTDNVTLFIQLGSERSELHILKNTQPYFFKSIPWGGARFSLAIQKHYKMTSEQAEKALKENGFIIPKDQTKLATQEQIELSNLLHQELAPFLNEIKQTKLIAKNFSNGITDFFITGKLALLPGLKHVFSNELNIKAKIFHGLSMLSENTMNFSEETEVSYSTAAGLALSLLSRERTSALQLRKFEFSKKSSSSDFDVKKLKGPAFSIALILFAFSLSVITRKSYYNSKIEQVNEQLEKGMRSFFGYISQGAVRSYLSDPDRLKKTIQKDLQKQKQVSSLTQNDPNSPLDFIKLLSNQIPSSILTEIITIQVGGDPKKPYTPNSENQIIAELKIFNQNAISQLKSIFGKILTDLVVSSPEEITLQSESNEKNSKNKMENKKEDFDHFWKVKFSGTWNKKGV